MTTSTSADEITVSVEEEDEGKDCQKQNGRRPTLSSQQPDGTGDTLDNREGRLLVASVFVEDALAHRHIDFIPTEYHVKLYRLYKKTGFVFMVYFSYLVLVSLALFERPAVPGLALPYWATITLEFACITFFIFRFCHEMCFTRFKSFWRDTKHVTCAAILTLTLVDIIAYTAVVETSSIDAPGAIRWSRPLRPFLIINFPEPRQIRRAMRNIRNTLPNILNVIILLFASVAVFSLMAMKLLGTKDLVKIDGTPYFDTFLDSFWDLWVLITTANNPDIMMPAYDSKRIYTVFFIFYLVVNLYMFMSVFLAVVYNTYKTHLKKVVKESVYHKRNLLSQAFDLMKEDERVDVDTFEQVMKNTMAEKTKDYFQTLWLILDQSGSGYIGRQDFFLIVELANFQVTDISDERTLAEKWAPNLYNSAVSKAVIRCVRHVVFRYLFDLIIFLNAICLAFDFNTGEWGFLALFMLEIILKLYSFGTRAFFRKLWNIFDVVIVGSAFVVSILELIFDDFKESVISLDLLLVLRVIRVFKIFQSIPRFKIVVNTMIHILPSVATYGAILLLFYYFFAIIGMECFAGLIRYTGYGDGRRPEELYCGNPLLKPSEFYRDHYCSNNFNDVIKSFVTLFELMVVNQWHVITEGHVLVTSKAARLFFFSFHFVCVIVILNIFVAFVIEAFILEYSFRASGEPISSLAPRINQMGLGYGSKPVLGKKARKPRDSGEEQLVNDDEDYGDEVDADHGVLQLDLAEDQLAAASSQQFDTAVSSKTALRFHLDKRTKTVQGLLEKMFESELKEEDHSSPSNISR